MKKLLAQMSILSLVMFMTFSPLVLANQGSVKEVQKIEQSIERTQSSGIFLSMAVAQEPVKAVAEPEDALSALGMARDAVELFKSKDWGMFAATLIMLLVWGWRKVGPKWLKGGKATTIAAFVIGVLVELAATLSTGGAFLPSILRGLLVGGASTGIWDLLKKKTEKTA